MKIVLFKFLAVVFLLLGMSMYLISCSSMKDKNPDVTSTSMLKTENKTMAEEAYNELKNNNVIVSYETALKSINVSTPISSEKISKQKYGENLTCWQETFKFEDGSKILLCKFKEKDGDDFIFMHEETKLIK